MDVGNLGEGDLPLHTLLPPAISRSRPAGIHQIEVLPIYLLTTTITLLLFSLTAFQYFGIFSDRKNIPAPARGLSSLPVLDSLPIQRMEPRRLAA